VILTQPWPWRAKLLAGQVRTPFGQGHPVNFDAFPRFGSSSTRSRAWAVLSAASIGRRDSLETGEVY